MDQFCLRLPSVEALLNAALAAQWGQPGLAGSAAQSRVHLAHEFSHCYIHVRAREPSSPSCDLRKLGIRLRNLATIVASRMPALWRIATCGEMLTHVRGCPASRTRRRGTRALRRRRRWARLPSISRHNEAASGKAEQGESAAGQAPRLRRTPLDSPSTRAPRGRCQALLSLLRRSRAATQRRSRRDRRSGGRAVRGRSAAGQARRSPSQ
mmetsp:Transcript_117638/g.374808  ORF Transcript_117638/g.374808 Transcript_117638/m.374808 type:complete len:210 (+) Transcript_117638:1616-2245(+)